MDRSARDDAHPQQGYQGLESEILREQAAPSKGSLEMRKDTDYLQAFSALCQLPLDIIIHIITIVATVEPVRPEGLPELIFEADAGARFSPVHDIVALVTTTSVCRYWRHLFLQTPSLWRHISSEFHPDLIKLFLQRSRLSPLHAEVSDGESMKSKRTLKNLRNFPGSYEPRAERYLSNTQLILKSFHRIRHLSISSSLMSTFNGPRPSPQFLCVLVDAFNECSQSGAAILKGIAIDSFWAPPSDREPRLEFLDSLLSQAGLSLPALSRVHLRLTYVPWHFLQSTSQSLTCLSTSIVSSKINVLEALKTVLEKHPALESLALHIQRDVGESSSHATHYSERERVVLPVLTKLLLTGDDYLTSSILGMMKLPSLRNICIADDSRVLASDDKEIQTLRQISELELPFADRLCVTFEGPYARFDLRKLKKGTYEPDDYDEVAFTYTYARQHITPAIKSSSVILLSQLKLMNLSGIKHIDIPIFPDPEPSFADRLVQLVPNVESINVHYGHPHFFYGTDRIETMLRPEQILQEHEEHLPCLRRLVFSGIHLGLQDLRFLSKLFGALKRRVEAGHPKVAVEFNNCAGIEDASTVECMLKDNVTVEDLPN